jgi:hypothetical protein
MGGSPPECGAGFLSPVLSPAVPITGSVDAISGGGWFIRFSDQLTGEINGEDVAFNQGGLIQTPSTAAVNNNQIQGTATGDNMASGTCLASYEGTTLLDSQGRQIAPFTGYEIEVV